MLSNGPRRRKAFKISAQDKGKQHLHWSTDRRRQLIGGKVNKIAQEKRVSESWSLGLCISRDWEIVSLGLLDLCASRYWDNVSLGLWVFVSLRCWATWYLGIGIQLQKKMAESNWICDRDSIERYLENSAHDFQLPKYWDPADKLGGSIRDIHGETSTK